MNSAPATFNVKTNHGTVHRLTTGRTFTQRGWRSTNAPGKAHGKADCGTATHMGQTLTDEAVNCPKCIAAAGAVAK